MSARLVASLLLALLSATLPSCAAYGAEYRELEISGYSGAEIWREINKFTTSRGFRVDTEETDIGRRIYQSRWVGGSYAFQRSGRKRFYAKIVNLRRGISDWVVQFYCEVHRVDDTSKNMRPEEDDWEYVGHDPAMERNFVYVMNTAFPRRRETDADGSGAPRSGR